MRNEATSKQLRIAYLGPPASFSHQASIEAFPPTTSATHHSLHAFKDIFSAIQNSSKDSPDAFDYAVLPIENSTNGGVVQVFDLLIQCGLDPDSCLFPDVEVVAEHYLEVHHCLYINKSAVPPQTTPNDTQATDIPLESLDITTLYTHPQVWGQCNNFLSAHFPPSHTERIDMPSTSAAAAFVAQSSTSPPTAQPPTTAQSGIPAAICSSLAGTANNLALVAFNIEDEPGKNTTRFLIVRNSHRKSPLPSHLTEPIPSPTPTSIFHKSLVTFTIPHNVPGSLALALDVFKTHGYNLTAITTRPSRVRNWHYVFFVESQIETEKGHEREPSWNEALSKDLAKVAERMCWLGSWVDRLDHR